MLRPKRPPGAMPKPGRRASSDVTATTGADAAIERLFAEAEAANGRGDMQAAYAALEQVVALDPDNPRALNTLALRAMRAGNARQAAEWLERAAAAAPEVASIRLNLADAVRALGDRERELQHLDSALALDPYLVPALIRKAQALEVLGRNPVPVWQAVLKTTPPSPEQPPALQSILAHAQRMVKDDGLRTLAAIAPALAESESAAGPAPRVRHGIDALLGARRIYRSEPTGLFIPRLPNDEFFDRGHFPWIADLEAATPTIRAELEALLDGDGGGFLPYVRYPAGTPVNQWEELNHSDRWSALFLWNEGAPVEAVLERCPETARILASIPRCDIPGRGPTAFFSLLKPRTHIPAHVGVTNCRSICHLPLIVPEGCSFRVGSETRFWREGNAFVFDDTIDHEAANPSDALRALLIFDVWNPWLGDAERAMLRAYYPARDAWGAPPASFL